MILKLFDYFKNRARNAQVLRASKARLREVRLERMQRLDTLPVGEFHWRILACLGMEDAFNPPQDADTLQEFRVMFEDIWNNTPGADSVTGQFNGLAVVAAGLLICGRLRMIECILRNIPKHKIELDHGCGWCNLVAFRVAAAVLPLPTHLTRYGQWHRGNPMVAEVQAWLEAHRENLSWSPSTQHFNIAGEPEPPKYDSAVSAQPLRLT